MTAMSIRFPAPANPASAFSAPPASEHAERNADPKAKTASGEIEAREAAIRQSSHAKMMKNVQLNPMKATS